MSRAGWYIFQISIIGFWVYAGHQSALEAGEKFHLGQALLVGTIFAFIGTLGVVIVIEQWRMWSARLRAWRAIAASCREIDKPRNGSRALRASSGRLSQLTKTPSRLGVRE